MTESKGRVSIADGSRKTAPMCLLKHLLFVIQESSYSITMFESSLAFSFEGDDCCDQSFICNFISHELLLRLGITCVFFFFVVFFFVKLQVEGNPA